MSNVFYEWDVEEIDSDGDIIDHHHVESYEVADTLKRLYEATEPYTYKVVLVKDSRASGRSWAYIEDGKLPENFEDSYGGNCGKVPERFHKEIEEYKKSLELQAPGLKLHM